MALKSIGAVFHAMEKCIVKGAKRLWDLYVLFLDWTVFSAIGADSLSAYCCAALVTVAYAAVVLLVIAVMSIVIYGIVRIVTSSAVVFLLVAIGLAAIVIVVRAAAKSWKNGSWKEIYGN